MRTSPGMTLVEMMTTLGVLAVLGVAAAPAFKAQRQNAERAAAVNELFHALFLARAEAIKRGELVTVCRSLNRQHCADAGPDWSAGWIVFVNRDRDDPPQRGPGEQLIRVSDGWRNGRVTSNRPAYSFRPAQQGVVNGTIVFCDERGPAQARAIIISHTGRPRIAAHDAAGQALRCPPGSP